MARAETNDTLERAPHIDQYVKRLLLTAGVGDRLPTPENDLIAAAELVFAGQLPLQELEKKGLLVRGLDVLTKALRKVLGLVDLRENMVWVDGSVLPVRQRFTKFHEVGHKILPWQKALMYVDDRSTLDPWVADLFEKEAHYFAASAIFQADRFEREAKDFDLSFNQGIRSLGARYGASTQATARRMVETRHTPCALVVLEDLEPAGQALPLVSVRGVHTSRSMSLRGIEWGNLARLCPEVWEVCTSSRRYFAGEEIVMDGDGQALDVEYEFLNTTYRRLLLVKAKEQRSRIKRFLLGLREA